MFSFSIKTRLASNAIANGLGQVFSVLIALVVYPSLMTHLGPEAFGLFGFFTILSTWMMLLDLGLSQTISRESARLRKSNDQLMKFRRILRSVEGLFVCVAILIAGAFAALSNLIVARWLTFVELEVEDVSFCVTVMGLIFSCKLLVSLYKGGLNGFEKQVWINGFIILMGIAKFVGGLGLVVFISAEITLYFLYQLILSLMEVVIISRKIYSELPDINKFLLPSIKVLKSVAPLASGVAFTSLIWILVSQIDKLLLSTLLPLKEYAFFSLVSAVSTGLLMLSSPIGTAVRPRLTYLNEVGQYSKMISLYRKSTLFTSVFCFPIVGVIAANPAITLFAWTGDIEVSDWGAEVLKWYALGNGIFLIVAFQYYLQFACGDLRYHVKGSLYFGGVQVGSIVVAAVFFGAVGTAITWFALQFFFFLFWPGFIHKKFIPGVHLSWLLRDVLWPLFSTVSVLVSVSFIEVDVYSKSRQELLMYLAFVWFLIILVNVSFSSVVRKEIGSFFSG